MILEEVFTRQVKEPDQEEKLKQDLPILEKSLTVYLQKSGQYEESPYPRWVNLGLPFKPVSILK